jgi:hypothetical protein
MPGITYISSNALYGLGNKDYLALNIVRHALLFVVLAFFPLTDQERLVGGLEAGDEQFPRKVSPTE